MENFLVTERHPPEGLQSLAVGKFLDANAETPAVLAASDTGLHLYGIQRLGPHEEVLVPISVLNLFGHVAAVACLPSPGDLRPDRALALLTSGELAVVEVREKRLHAVAWHRLPTDIDDSAQFVAVNGDCVAVSSNFGRVTLLQAPPAAPDGAARPLHPVATFHLRDFVADGIMPSGAERVTDFFLTEMARGAASPNGSPGKMLWVALESAQPSHTFSWLAATRVAAVAWPPPAGGAPSARLPVQWHPCPLPGATVPASQPASGFASIVESNTRGDGRTLTAVCTAPDLSGAGFPYQELRRVVLEPHRDSVALARWDEFDPGEGPVVVAASAAGAIYRLAAADVAANTALYEPRKWLCLAEEPDAPGEPPALPGWVPCCLAPDRDEADPIVVAPCGEVPWGVHAMEVLPGGRLVVLTRDCALLLLRLRPDDAPPARPDDGAYPPRCMVRRRAVYAVSHALQTCGGLEEAAPAMAPDGTLLAIKGCPRELAAARAARFDAAAAAAAAPLSRAFSADEGAAAGVGGERSKPCGPAEAAAEQQSEAAMEVEGPEEAGDGAEAGGAGCGAAYGAPGALVALHRDVTPECMFESGPGEAEGTTGLWPLRRDPGDAAHAAVLLSTSTGARVLAVDGGAVFSDVTDALAVASDRETLAAGNLGVGDWVAQVTAAGVRAFRLGGGGGGSAVADWSPPASATVSSGAVSEGIVVLQLMRGGRHALVALALREAAPGGGAPSLAQLGALDLAREASCIGNAVLAPNGASAALAVGTYASAVLLLELDLLNGGCSSGGGGGGGGGGFSVLGEVVAGRVGYGDFMRVLKEHHGARWVPGSPLAAAKHAGRGAAAAGATLPFSLVATPGAPPPGEAPDYRRHGLQLWVSTRSGDVCALAVGPASHGAPGAPPRWGLPPGVHPRCAAHGTLPPALALLPHLPRLGPSYAVLAASRRAALLRLAPGGAAVGELPLRLPELARATPLVLAHPSGGERLFLLAATAAGAVALHSLEPHQRSRAVGHPLAWPPDRLATHPELAGVAAVAGRRWHRFPGRGDEANTLAELAVVDPATGRLLHALGPLTMPAVGETVTGLSLLPPRALGGGEGGDPAAERFACFMLATSGTNGSQAALHGASGRLLLFGVPSAPAAAPLELLDALSFRDWVTALDACALAGEAPAEGPHAVAFVGVGLRLAAYQISLRGPPSGGPAGRSFQRTAWAPLNATANRLRIDAEGTVHVCSSEGAAAFAYQHPWPQAPGGEPGGQPPRPSSRGSLALARCSPWATAGVSAAAPGGGGTLTLANGGALVWAPEGRGHREAAVNLGDLGSGLAQVQGRAALADGAGGGGVMAVPTQGGGVYEVNFSLGGVDDEDDDAELRRAAAAVLRSLQAALLEEGGGGGAVRAGAAAFLFSRPDPATKEPKSRIFRHPPPPPPTTASTSPEGPEAATAEGPEPPAAVEEQPLARFIAPDGGAGNGPPDAPGALDGRVLRLFLEAPRERQQELVQHMACQERWMPEAAPDARAAAMAYCLAGLGVGSIEF